MVVGAGIAGLTVTKELRRRGWPPDRVVLLEATSTIGGRVSKEQLQTASKEPELRFFGTLTCVAIKNNKMDTTPEKVTKVNKKI